MAFSLDKIKKNTTGAPRVILYGTAGIGKTTFAASAPNPVFIQCEDGLGMIDAPAAPLAKSYADVKEQLEFFAMSEEHDYSTLALDSLDALEPMIWASVCEAGGKKQISDFSYGKGYDAALEEWRFVQGAINTCRDRGMITIMIAHAHAVKFESPDSDAYDRYNVRLHRKASALWIDWADVVGFANYQSTVVAAEGDRKRAVGKGERILFTEERPQYVAKNRFGLPHKLPLSWDAFMEAMPS